MVKLSLLFENAQLNSQKEQNLRTIEKNGCSDIIRIIDGQLYLTLYHGTAGKDVKKLQKSDTLDKWMYLAVDEDIAKRFGNMKSNDLLLKYFFIPIGAGLLENTGYFLTSEKLKLDIEGGSLANY